MLTGAGAGDLQWRLLMSDETSKLRSTWESAATGWAKWEETFSAGLSGATDTLIDMAGVHPGMRVLDLACGAGSQTVQVARRVGPNGRVVAIDISATMLEHAHRNAATAGLHNVEFVECPAEDLEESAIQFDASISRLGLMLFPSPDKALRAVQRVLKAAARFAALVFTTPENNPFMAQPMAILLRHAGKSPPVPGQPGIFALGGNGILENVMKGVGLVDVKSTKLRASLGLARASAALEMMQQAFGAYRAVVADLSDQEKSAAWRQVYDCLRDFEGARGFETEFEFIIGSGAKPN